MKSKKFKVESEQEFLLSDVHGRLAIATAVGQVPPSTYDVTGQVLSYVPIGIGNSISAVDASGNIQSVQFTASMTDAVGAQLNFAGSSTWPAGSVHDVYWVIGAGLCTVAWTSGAPSVPDAYYGGLTVNGSAMTAQITSGTIAVPQYQGRFLGSIRMSAAGQMSRTFSFGQNRTCDVWNAYNQVEIELSAGNPNGAINAVAYSPNWAPILGDAANSLVAFTGRPTLVHAEYRQALWMQCYAGHSAQAWNGIGWNSTSNQSGSSLACDCEGYSGPGYLAGQFNVYAQYRNDQAQGVNVVTALLKTGSVDGSPVNSGKSCIYIGAAEFDMQLTTRWMG